MPRTVRQRTRRRHPYVALILGMLPALAGAACDWSRPGAAPYRGPLQTTIAAAVHAYADIPEAARLDLINRIKGQRDDAIVLITRTGMVSPQGRATDLRDMHWRHGLCTGPVVRTGWADDRVEPALVYCSGPHCLAVPVVCGNVSRITFTFVERHEPELQHWDYKPQPVRTVPEPGTLVLVAAGLAAMWRRA
jgi:hypothetical protein